MFEDPTELVAAIDAEHARVCEVQRRLLVLIAEVDREEAWRDSGARDTAHWLAMRYGLSGWKAHRWIAASHALERLPRLSSALERGRLGIDNVVELCRFATSETESQLIRWASDVSCGTIRHRGDLAIRASSEEIIGVERDRSVSWWTFDEGRRFGLEAELPAAQGTIVAQALERMAETIPVMPGETGSGCTSRPPGRCPRGAVFRADRAGLRSRSGDRGDPRAGR